LLASHRGCRGAVPILVWLGSRRRGLLGRFRGVGRVCHLWEPWGVLHRLVGPVCSLSLPFVAPSRLAPVRQEVGDALPVCYHDLVHLRDGGYLFLVPSRQVTATA